MRHRYQISLKAVSRAQGLVVYDFLFFWVHLALHKVNATPYNVGKVGTNIIRLVRFMIYLVPKL